MVSECGQDFDEERMQIIEAQGLAQKKGFTLVFEATGYRLIKGRVFWHYSDVQAVIHHLHRRDKTPLKPLAGTDGSVTRAAVGNPAKAVFDGLVAGIKTLSNYR